MPQSAILGSANLTLDGTLDELEHLSGWIGQFCVANALDKDVEFDLNLALEELFTNTVRHGGCEGARDAAQISLVKNDGAIHVEYSDRGIAFNPLELPPPNLAVPLEERQPGGLGVYMVRQLMQDVAYERRGESNQITMTRRTVST